MQTVKERFEILSDRGAFADPLLKDLLAAIVAIEERAMRKRRGTYNAFLAIIASVSRWFFPEHAKDIAKLISRTMLEPVAPRGGIKPKDISPKGLGVIESGGCDGCDEEEKWEEEDKTETGTGGFSEDATGGNPENNPENNPAADVTVDVETDVTADVTTPAAAPEKIKEVSEEGAEERSEEDSEEGAEERSEEDSEGNPEERSEEDAQEEVQDKVQEEEKAAEKIIPMLTDAKTAGDVLAYFGEDGKKMEEYMAATGVSSRAETNMGKAKAIIKSLKG